MLNWTERKKRERDWRSERREFIYLDEVSVISLVAARDGGIADTITETLARTAEAEGRVSVSVPGKGGASAGVESRHKVTSSSSREVVRRTVIQSTFGDLRFGGSRYSPPLVQEYRDVPKKFLGYIENSEDLSAARGRKLKRLKKRGLLTPLETLRRGDVIELDIQLRPNKVFSIAAGIDSFADLMQGRSSIFGDASSLVADIVPMGEVIDRLMVGLIPIHGAPTNIVVVDIDGEPHLVDKRVIKEASPFANAVRTWELVGVTEEPSYWKDLRRVLYTRDRFTVYARVVDPSLTTRWNPVKLSGLIGDVSEEAAQAIVALPEVLEQSLNQPRQEPLVDVRGMFHLFAELLRTDFDAAPDALNLAAAVSEAVAIFTSAGGDMSQERAAFDAVLAAFTTVNERELDREDLVAKRTLARASANATSALPLLADETTVAPVDQLEVEVVAIYW